MLPRIIRFKAMGIKMKKVFFDFLKDSLNDIVSFFLSILFILIYYNLTAGITDIVYPLLIATTIFMISRVISWIKYYYFHVNIYKLDKLKNDKILEMTYEQRRVTEVFSDLQEKYLIEISKKNAESNASRLFFSQWVHNMKTPVSILSLILQKFERESEQELENEDREQINEFISAIREENIKLRNGLENLLNILRMDEFAKDYEPEAVDLLVLLKEIINAKKSLFIYNNVFPKIVSGEDKIIVLTDEKWNGFMLDQLINNAVKYSKVEGERKTLKFIINRIGDKIQLKIIDEGIGINKNDLNRVFEPFFTGENGRKYKDSSGIGLYMCSLIANNLNHNLEIESQYGVGTTVIVTYPLKR